MSGYVVEWSNVYSDATDYRDAMRQALADLDYAISQSAGATYFFVTEIGSDDDKKRIDIETDDPRQDLTEDH